jgi:uroporphyrin-III C-methyltransferase
MISTTTQKGKVVIAGAGPGDPELITVKATRYIKHADVILVDRLVSKDILTTYASPQALIIEVGKQNNKVSSVSQESINQQLVEYALQGKNVVRLKGGDVAFFSNVLDELQILIDAQIEFEIIPGITAASGASAYAGIPLTARGYATSVRFLTYYKSDVVTDEYWKELANTNDTLVLYMTSEMLSEVVSNLIKHEIGSDKKLAVIEQATTPFQKIYISDIYNCTLLGNTFLSPAIVVIGKVVSLHEKFKWFGSDNENTYYFKPLN